MPQPKPDERSDFNRINTLAALLARMCVVVRAYLQQRSLVPLTLLQHFQRQRALKAVSGVYDPKDGWRVVCEDPDTVPEVYLNLDNDAESALIGEQGDDLPYPGACPIVPKSCSITLIKERVYLKERLKEIRCLAAKALPIIQTAGPLAQYGIGESVGQYLTEIQMRVKKIVGTVQLDLKVLAIAVQRQVMYAPWMKDWNNQFDDPSTAATDLLKDELLPKLDDDAMRLGSLPMATESTKSDPLEAKPMTADRENVAPQRKPGEESRLVTLKYAADHWFHSFTRQALRKAIDDGTVAAKRFGRGKWAFCLVELLEKGDTIYRDAKPESE